MIITYSHASYSNTEVIWCSDLIKLNGQKHTTHCTLCWLVIVLFSVYLIRISNSHFDYNDCSVVLNRGGYLGWDCSDSGSVCFICCATLWSIEVRHSHSAWACFYRVPHSIYGNCFVCVLPMQPSCQGTLQVRWVSCDTSWVQTSSEGDVSINSTDEVALVHSDVLEIVVIALTVLSYAPIHLTLYCGISAGGLCLQSMGHITSFTFCVLHCNYCCGDMQVLLTVNARHVWDGKSCMFTSIAISRPYIWESEEHSKTVAWESEDIREDVQALQFTSCMLALTYLLQHRFGQRRNKKV